MSAPDPIGVIGVLLMTYGSPGTLDDIPEYLANVRGGRPAEPALAAEFRRRYDLIGGSPLISITKDQAAALQDELARRRPQDPLAPRGLRGPVFHVGAGMRFSRPTVADGVRELTESGATSLIGIIMSPQYSPILMSGYHQALDAAVAALPGAPAPALAPLVTVAGAWHRQPRFLRALAQRIDEALQCFAAEERPHVRVLLTAHSMPKRVIEKEPDYIGQLHETAEAVAALAGLSPDRWMFCYQSAGHTPEEWLKPDFADVMPALAAAGARQVLIAPVQFLADHLEILYDIEIGARAQAERHGIVFQRTASLNTSALFIAALADVVEDTLFPSD